MKLEITPDIDTPPRCARCPTQCVLKVNGLAGTILQLGDEFTAELKRYYGLTPNLRADLFQRNIIRSDLGEGLLRCGKGHLWHARRRSPGT